MEKMTRPEMKVVRFKESDIIVASGGLRNGDVLSLSGFGNDGDTSNNYVSLNNGSKYQLFADANSRNAVLEAIGATGSEYIYNPSSGNRSSLSHLFENVDTTKTTWDTDYVYSSSDSSFRKQ